MGRALKDSAALLALMVTGILQLLVGRSSRPRITLSLRRSQYWSVRQCSPRSPRVGGTRHGNERNKVLLSWPDGLGYGPEEIVDVEETYDVAQR